jgi:V/A-type H+-transporting ATPase subunit A
MMARESGVYVAVTVAEYFRDMGYDVLVIADSTSRWAEALREFASRTGALPAEEGYPATLASALAAFYERAGAVLTTGGTRGSVTIVGAVSPPGGDLTEPVTAHSQRFVRGLWTLDRELAYARHYPAVSWSASFSRDADAVAAWHARDGAIEWSGRRSRVMRLLAEADRLAALADLIGIAGLAATERVTVLTARLMRDAVLRQSALSRNDGFCTAAKTAALVEAVLAVGDRLHDLALAGRRVETLEATDFGPLVRAREMAGPEDTASVLSARDCVLSDLEAGG